MSLRTVGDCSYEFRHPRCVQEREDDIQEVREMLAHEEFELAEDELRWLLQDCPDFMAAHVLLGRIAEEEHRLDLARAHYGYAFEIGCKALAGRAPGRLDHRRPANRPWFEAAAGLLRCLVALGEHDKASDVLNTVAQWDPTVRLNEL